MLATAGVLYLLNLMASESLNTSDVRDVVFEPRTPVKLNPKQAFLMNQVVTIFALTDSKDVACKNQSREYQEALRAFEPWALKMFDASSKIQSGILAGNLMEYGSFEQCISIRERTRVGTIKGKQCSIRIVPSVDMIKKILSFRNISEQRYERSKSSLEGASFHWSVCVPDSCGYSEVNRHFKKTILSLTEGLELNVTTTHMSCSTAEDEERPLTGTERKVLIFLAVLLAIIALCTIVDVWNRARNENRSKLVEIFSAYSNTIYIMSYKEEIGLDCLHGIRFLSMCYVVIGHRYLMSLFFPSVNALDILEWVTEYPSTFITGATVSVDSFFLMGSLLVSYYFFDHVYKGGKFNLAGYYFHRFLRLSPSCGVVVLVVATLSPRMGSGPQWKEISEYVASPCRQYWWSILLHVQNYVNPANMCIIQTWYLSCETQCYIFSPVILYPLWKWRRLGVVNLVVWYSLATATNFYLAWKNEYRADMMIDNRLPQSDFFAYHYTMPYVRAGPYILGLGFGYLLYITKDSEIRMGKFTLFLGWSTTATVMLTAILSNHKFQREDYEYNKLEVCLYLSLMRSAWVAGLMWIIWACSTGHGGLVNTILSARGFQVFGRIAYGTYLVHMPIQYLSGGARKMPSYFSNYYSLHAAFGDICVSIMVAFLLTILVEYPGVRISSLIMKKCFNRVKPKTTEDKIK